VSADNERAAVAPEAGEAGGSATTSDSAPDAQPGRYLVQVASFSTVENTNNLSTRLREDGLPVLLDTIEADAGILHRVRVGPFDDASAANAALETIRSRTPDLNPRIIDLRPDESAPVTEPSDPLVRWVVQAGSFSDQENAQDLVTRLRNEGYAAYVVTVTDAASTQYKVRIGPEIERQMALDIAAGIAEKLNLDGIVMSVD
jgi:cell division septation protein DedD